MSQTSHFLMSIVWPVGILAVCAIAVRWMISAFNLRRERVMKVFFILACLFLMIANAGYAFISGCSHSAVVQDQARCILVPFVWIGKNIGIRHTPFFTPIAGLWLAVMFIGLYLTKKGKSPFWALLLPPSLSLLAILLTSVMGWEYGRVIYENDIRNRHVLPPPPLAVAVGSETEVKISPEVVIQEIRCFAAKGTLVESDLEKLNQMAKADRSALLKALIAAGNSATTTDEMDISVGMIAYYDFSIEELLQGKKTATPSEIPAYDALIRETQAGDVKIRRDEVIARLKETRKGLTVSRLHQIDLKVGMERQKVEEQVAKALSRTNQYSPYGNNLTGGIVQYPDGDWVLEVKYKAGEPGPLVANPDGKVQGYPSMDETVLEYAIKGKPASEGKGLRKTDLLNDGLYQMETDIRKPGVDRNYGGVEDCRVTVQGQKIRIDSFGGNTNGWYEGTIVEGHISMLTHFQKLDPIIQATQITDVWKGDLQSDGSVTGTMEAFAGTNKYMSGTWSLKGK